MRTSAINPETSNRQHGTQRMLRKIDVTGAVTGQAGALIPNSGNIFNGIVSCGLHGTYPGCMTGHLFNPAPRVGFAYDVFGNGKVSGGAAATVSSSSTRMAMRVTRRCSKVRHLWCRPRISTILSAISNVGGSGIQFPLSVDAIPTHAVWPYVQQYNLAVQGELPSHTVVQVRLCG